jgi:hypothetical protein
MRRFAAQLFVGEYKKFVYKATQSFYAKRFSGVCANIVYGLRIYGVATVGR